MQFNNPFYYSGLAELYLGEKKYKDAEGLLQKAITIDDNSGELHYFLGITMGYNDRFEEAQKQFEKAMSLGYIP